MTVREMIMLLYEPDLRLLFFEHVPTDKLSDEIGNNYRKLLQIASSEGTLGDLWWEGLYLSNDFARNSRLLSVDEFVRPAIGDNNWDKFYRDFSQNPNIHVKYVSLDHLLYTLFETAESELLQQYWGEYFTESEYFTGLNDIVPATICPNCKHVFTDPEE